MRKPTFYILVAGLFVALIAGCTPTMPLDSGLNDRLVYNIETNDTTEIQLSFKSDVKDGKVKPYDKGYDEIRSSYQSTKINHPQAYRQLINKYTKIKFNTVSENAPNVLKVHLRDFRIMQYNPSGQGDTALSAIAGTDPTFQVGAKVVTEVTLMTEGQEPVSKVIQATAEETADGDVRMKMREVINSANNRSVSLINQYLESKGL